MKPLLTAALPPFGEGLLDELPLAALLELVGDEISDPLRRRADDLAALSRLGAGRLERELGLGEGAARRLAAAFALGRRVEEERWVRGDALRSPGGVYRLMAPLVRGLEQERFHALLLDGKHRLRAIERISEGTLTTSLVHPREVFRAAVRAAAAAVVVVHNHPSGDPEPSAEDLAVTSRLAEAGRTLGLPLLDHVVVGQGSYVSLRERGRL